MVDKEQNPQPLSDGNTPLKSPEPGKPVELRVGASIKERRIDKYLHGRFSNYSRAMIQQILKAKAVTVNGQIVKQSYQLTAADRIVFTLPEIPSKEIIGEHIPINIIYEDDDLLIINKRANMIVHPARGNTNGTLVNALVWHCEHLSSGLGERRPGIVHRLDKNTTGVLIVTKNDTAQWKVATQFQERLTKKTYLAVVHGTPELTSDRICAPIGTDTKKREKQAVRADGKEAVTIYHTLEEFKGFSLLEINILTGRTHQIRVHMTHLKHPIVADDMYSGKLVYPWQLENAEPRTEEPIIARPALHAASIEFKHPTTEKMVRFQAPLPDDMQNLLEQLRIHRK
jgi:23S rRNA pseudouridine1911/1915/1917 synthase